MTKLQRWKRDKWLPGVRDGVKAGKKDVTIKGNMCGWKHFYFFSNNVVNCCGTKLQFLHHATRRRN